jgi:formate--tetrahydrofolate ligase
LHGYDANIEYFNAFYAFATEKGAVRSAAIFKDGEMLVDRDPELDQWDIRVNFKNVDALWKFIFSGGTDIVESVLANDVQVYGNLNYLFKFGFMARDLKERLGNIFVGYTYADKPVFARELKANGAMAALLKDAIKPNLVQTLEGTPAIIHGGPFANIAQGTNSLIATKTGLSLSDYVVTEAGFASELGAEKFFDIKARIGNLNTSAVVIVATVRALKYHGGAKLSSLNNENPDFLIRGFDNLDKHIENMRYFGFRPVIAINRFDSDTAAELDLLIKHCELRNVKVALNEAWAEGGDGAVDLAYKVLSEISECTNCYQPLYDLEWPFEKKIEIICSKMYGADHVEYTVKAKNQLDRIDRLGFGNLAVCIAKTQKSLSDDQNRRGRPQGFTIKIREVELSSGAGFIVPIAGTIMRMPGLPNIPSAEKIDIDNDGRISGLF